MEDKKTSKNKRRCSFCGRSEDEVGFLITGVNGCICDTCSEQAYEIVQEALHQHGNSSAGNLNLKELPKPKDIKEFLDQYVILESCVFCIVVDIEQVLAGLTKAAVDAAARRADRKVEYHYGR